jgi:hypothetical protein
MCFRLCAAIAAAIIICALFNGQAVRAGEFRPPAAPLVTSDPYMSIWSESDTLTGDVTRHWTHEPAALDSLIRVDGSVYRLMGVEPDSVSALPQTGVNVYPTRSAYEFGNGQVRVTMTFLTPVLPNDLDAYSLPLSYITWRVLSADGKPHDVSIYISASSELAVNSTDQKVVWSRQTAGPLTALKVGTVDQTLFQPAGDDTRIDWGYAYLAGRSDQSSYAIGATDKLLEMFASGTPLGGSVDARMPQPVSDGDPALALTFDLGSVSSPVERHAIVAYDEIYSIDFFGENLRPYWKRNGESALHMLARADREYPELTERCAVFDMELAADLLHEGGAKYARIASLAYRECAAACGLAADHNGKPLLFTKENTSNGDISTVDVIYPMDPIWILFSPTLAKASLVPDLAYAASPHWKFPNAPHDLGTYPVAMGRDDGGEGMPVEESGNVIILCDAIARDDGNACFVSPWWPQITRWAQYLERFGLDPGDQLCTDDFMGHLAHNANLSVKAIVALAAYGDLCRMRGDAADAKKFHAEAVSDARHWLSVCRSGDHSLLAFDKPGTWSQKYNLVWDKILGTDLFPPKVGQGEVEYYESVMHPYGVPLDSRTSLTKTDWSVWSATLANNRADFEKMIAPIYAYLNTTTARDPIADSYVTDDIHSGGMHARPVVGGIFIKMLADPAMWRKWSSRDTEHVTGWAKLPQPLIVREVVPSSQKSAQIWRYTTTAPDGDGWTKPGFDDTSWQSGPGGFGTVGTPNAVVRTTWSTDDIWIRRSFVMPAAPASDLSFWVYHDEDIQVYVNGVLAASEPGFVPQYETLNISSAARRLLKPGAQITLAVHCHQTVGGQDIDVGISSVEAPWQ